MGDFMSKMTGPTEPNAVTAEFWVFNFLNKV